MFRSVVHCDWSLRAAGRWMAEAHSGGGGCWHASGPRAVPEPAAFLDALFAAAAEGPVLAAFDFPIGLPGGFGPRTGHADFPALLDAFGRGENPEFFEVAGSPGEVGPLRPFYPRRPGGALRRHLLDGHGVADVAALTRACERGGTGSKAAGCMFWTLGANQVGKAALHGWREVIVPARARGARLWPFDGALDDLAAGGLVLAESYPGDAYGQIGLRIRGKRDRALRAGLAPRLLGWAGERGVALDPALRAAILDGFPPGAGADDGFDAAVGLLAALAVVRGERAAGPPATALMRRWEGWILGKLPGEERGGPGGSRGHRAR